MQLPKTAEINLIYLARSMYVPIKEMEVRKVDLFGPFVLLLSLSCVSGQNVDIDKKCLHVKRF